MRFPQPHRLERREGIVLVTVVIMTMVMMILAVAIMSANSNQSLSNQHQVERIKAEQLAKGAFWYNYMSLAVLNSTATPPAETLDLKLYTVNIIPGGHVANFIDADSYSATVSYPRW